MKKWILAGAIASIATGALAQNSLYGGFGTGSNPNSHGVLRNVLLRLSHGVMRRPTRKQGNLAPGRMPGVTAPAPAALKKLGPPRAGSRVSSLVPPPAPHLCHQPNGAQKQAGERNPSKNPSKNSVEGRLTRDGFAPSSESAPGTVSAERQSHDAGAPVTIAARTLNVIKRNSDRRIWVTSLHSQVKVNDRAATVARDDQPMMF